MKRSLAFIAAVVMAVSFVSCGKKDESSSADRSAAEKSSPASQSEKTEEETEKKEDEDTSSYVSPLSDPPVSTAKVSLDFGSEWLDKKSYEASVKDGTDDSIDYNDFIDIDDDQFMYLHDGDSSDGTAVVSISKPAFHELYTKDAVDNNVELIKSMMEQNFDSGDDYEFYSVEAADIGERRAVYVCEKNKVFGEIVKSDQYQFFDEGDIYTIKFYAPVDRYDDLKPEFDSLIASLKVEH